MTLSTRDAAPDILRGFALWGIVVVNVGFFAASVDRGVWLRSLGGGVFAALRGGLVAAITQDWLQVGVAV